MKKSAKSLTGEIVSFNISPKGFPEGLLLKQGDEVVQINFPHHSGPAATEGMETGQTVTLQAKPFDDEGYAYHRVYEWTPDKTALKGKVKQINYSLHGEPNGAILESGEFVHTKPHGAKAAKLKVGQEVNVEGDARKSPAGFTVIEVKKINGAKID